MVSDGAGFVAFLSSLADTWPELELDERASWLARAMLVIETEQLELARKHNLAIAHAGPSVSPEHVAKILAVAFMAVGAVSGASARSGVDFAVRLQLLRGLRELLPLIETTAQLVETMHKMPCGTNSPKAN